ncbi:deacetylase family protein [Rhodopirellula maiorica SM1]|uniref:Deacetylase family protein n=2 Tax=Novipirellula TaxID=2795426 RepID=M5RFP1_9BACT|nr:deacetylase family protein [Rhodopirellula maiorica SM1]
MISLTFDDALDVHLDNAVVELNDAGLRGTFYAHLSAESLFKRATDWRAVAAAGHEIGNHTVFHPAAEDKNWVTTGNAIEYYTLDRMRMELDLANRWLESIDSCTDRTFAFPCSNPTIGRPGPLVRACNHYGLRFTRWPGMIQRAGLDFGSTCQSYAPLLPEYFVAGRGGGLTFEMTPPPIKAFDQYQLPSAACDGHSTKQMQDFVGRCLDAESWAILQFHGIGGGHHMDCSLENFRQLTRWIADHHADQVVTVRQGAQQIYSSTSLPKSTQNRA